MQSIETFFFDLNVDKRAQWLHWFSHAGIVNGVCVCVADLGK